jgi:hypothetical protein
LPAHRRLEAIGGDQQITFGPRAISEFGYNAVSILVHACDGPIEVVAVRGQRVLQRTIDARPRRSTAAAGHLGNDIAIAVQAAP